MFFKFISVLYFQIDKFSLNIHKNINYNIFLIFLYKKLFYLKKIVKYIFIYSLVFTMIFFKTFQSTRK